MYKVIIEVVFREIDEYRKYSKEFDYPHSPRIGETVGGEVNATVRRVIWQEPPEPVILEAIAGQYLNIPKEEKETFELEGWTQED